MTTSRKFSDEQLIELHGQGLNVREIAEQLEVSKSTIRFHARRLGLKFRFGKRRFTDEELIELHRQGLNVRVIATRFMVCEATVLRHAKRLGLKLKRESVDKRLLREWLEGNSGKRRRDEEYYIFPPPSRLPYPF